PWPHVEPRDRRSESRHRRTQPDRRLGRRTRPFRLRKKDSVEAAFTGCFTASFLICHSESSEAPAERGRRTPVLGGSPEKRICIPTTRPRCANDCNPRPIPEAVSFDEHGGYPESSLASGTIVTIDGTCLSRPH